VGQSRNKNRGKLIIVEPNPQKANRLHEDLKELLVDIDVEIVNSKDQIVNETAGVIIGSEEDNRAMLFSILRNQNSQIDMINSRVDQKFENLDAKMDAIKESVDQIHEWLTGNGSPEKGYIVRIDRLERAEGERKEADTAKNNAFWAAIFSAVAAAVAAIISAILSF
jgi:hypothetical protein